MTLATMRWLHRWLGILVALPVAIQGLTGAILAIEPLLPEFPPYAVGVPKTANDIVAAALTHAGEGARATRYTPAADPGFSAMVQIAVPGAPPVGLKVDPATLAVSAPDASAAVWPWLRSLHVAFLAPDYSGRAIGGWFGIGLTLLVITGVPIWWPRKGEWKDGFTVAVQAKGARFHRRLHGAVGAWSMVLVLVLAMTGVVLAFPRTSRGLLGLEAGGGPPRAARAAGPVVLPDIDSALIVASGAAPQARVRSVILPAGPRDAIRVFMVHPGGEGATGGLTVQVDAAATKVVAIQDSRAAAPADRLYRWIHDLHEGLGLGPAWRVLVVLGGLAVPLFAITGPWMWWLKRRARKRVDTARKAALAGEPGKTPTTGIQHARQSATAPGE